MKSEKHFSIDELLDIFSDRKAGAEEFFKFFSVLVPVIKKDEGLYLLYERRARHMARQPGEVCFPGGELEEGEDTEACALRETWEEIGIGSDRIKIICQLDTIYTYSNFAMFCYLGLIEHEALCDMKLNRDEVEEVFLVSVDDLMEKDPDIYWTDIIPHPPDNFPYETVTGGDAYNWRQGRVPVPVYQEFDGNVIWGLTARITKRFIDSVKEKR